MRLHLENKNKYLALKMMIGGNGFNCKLNLQSDEVLCNTAVCKKKSNLPSDQYDYYECDYDDDNIKCSDIKLLNKNIADYYCDKNPLIHVDINETPLTELFLEKVKITWGPEIWLKDEPKDYILKKETPIPPPEINDSKGNWPSNDPFILSFLLEGFLSGNVDSGLKTVAGHFQELLQSIGTDLTSKLKDEIEQGKKYGIWKDKYKPAVKSEFKNISYIISLTEDKIDKNKEILNTDMIVEGGYRSSIGSHALAFRFLPKQKRIIFTNTGVGLEKHPKYNNMSQPYYIWEINDNEEYKEYSKAILAAIESDSINNIEDAYEWEVNIKMFAGFVPLQFRKHVVDITKKEKKIVFIENGISEKATPLWITHADNWVIHKGTLYCKRQISDTCSFHAVFWQLLLEIWMKGGSKAASIFEEKCRDYILEKALNLGPPIGDKISEQITCLQLIARTYRDFNGRNKVLQTLLLHQESKSELTYPKVTTTLPTDDVKILPSNFSSLVEKINTLLTAKTINDALNSLHSLLSLIHVEIQVSLFNEKYVGKRKKKKNFPKLFRIHFARIAVAAVKHVGQISNIRESNLDELQKAVSCYIICSRIEAYEQLRELHLSDEACIIFISKLHSSLPQDDKLPVHTIPYDDIDSLLPNNARCEAARFVRNYGNYTYRSDVEENSNIVKTWETIKGTIKHPITQKIGNPKFIFRDTEAKPMAEHGEKPMSKSDEKYFEFIQNNPVGECIAATFEIMQSEYVNTKYGNIKYPVDDTFFVPRDDYNYIMEPREDSRKKISNDNGFIADLNSGVLLVEMQDTIFTTFALPE